MKRHANFKFQISTNKKRKEFGIFTDKLLLALDEAEFPSSLDYRWGWNLLW